MITPDLGLTFCVVLQSIVIFFTVRQVSHLEKCLEHVIEKHNGLTEACGRTAHETEKDLRRIAADLQTIHRYLEPATNPRTPGHKS